MKKSVEKSDEVEIGFINSSKQIENRNSRMSTRLKKSRTDKFLTGVCGGFAEFLGWDPTLIRILYLILVFTSFGTAVVLYFVLALIMPD